MRKFIIASLVSFCVMFFAGIASAETIHFIVKNGDNFWKLSKKYHVKHSAIIKENYHLFRKPGNPHWIYPGQKFSVEVVDIGKLKHVSKPVGEKSVVVSTKEAQMKKEQQSVPNATPVAVQTPIVAQAPMTTAQVPVAFVFSEKKKEDPYAGCEDLAGPLVIMDDSIRVTMDSAKLTCDERRKILKDVNDQKKREHPLTDLPFVSLKPIQHPISSAEKSASVNRVHLESMLEGFYGCDDILSECKGGKGEIDIYKKISNGVYGHSLGLNLMAFGAVGEVSKFQFVWHKIYGGGGINYKYFGEKNHLVIKEDVLFQTLEKSITFKMEDIPIKFKTNQSDLLLAQSLKFLHRQNDYLYWGVNVSYVLPIANLKFSSESNAMSKSDQARGELKLIAQQKINNTFQLRENFSPISYQA